MLSARVALRPAVVRDDRCVFLGAAAAHERESGDATGYHLGGSTDAR